MRRPATPVFRATSDDDVAALSLPTYPIARLLTGLRRGDRIFRSVRWPSTTGGGPAGSRKVLLCGDDLPFRQPVGAEDALFCR